MYSIINRKKLKLEDAKLSARVEEECNLRGLQHGVWKALRVGPTAQPETEEETRSGS